MVGFRRIFQLGIVVFTLGSLGCTIAHSLPMLALSRAIQGFGAAGIMSQNGALGRFTYPSVPLSRRWVAKLCRSEWVVTRLPIRARRLAARQAD